jgi:cytochrome c-type biogenesis protein CcmH
MSGGLPPLPRAGEGSVRRGLARLVASILFFITAPLFAQPSDAALEARVKALSAELRCLVCQNQTIADSDAAVARDMREQVRTQLKAGKSEAEVKTYMTERFGDFVLYKPAFKATTFLLWAGPFLVLALGLFGFVRHLRSNSAKVIPTELSDAERDRARALLNTDADAPRSAEPSHKS